MSTGQVPSTSACGPGDSSRPTTDDSDPEPETHRRRCDNQQRLPKVAPDASSAGMMGGEGGSSSGRGSRVSKASTLENDVREVRRILQAYALRLSERDAHARITKQWQPGRLSLAILAWVCTWAHARVTKQWRLVARVLDRLFFFFYCATIVISLATIFPR